MTTTTPTDDAKKPPSFEEQCASELRDPVWLRSELTERFGEINAELGRLAQRAARVQCMLENGVADRDDFAEARTVALAVANHPLQSVCYDVDQFAGILAGAFKVLDNGDTVLTGNAR